MNYMPKMNRRAFIVARRRLPAADWRSASTFRSAPQSADAQAATPELNAWVVVKPDDTVVVRIARAEMGQGSLTGLAQLVAEELECDWSKVTTEIPTPGQSLARKRVWGNLNATGSRSIRKSHEYVRQGGAIAREMLKQAAANEWKVPVGEVTVEQGRDHAQGVEPQHHLRQGGGRRRQARAAGAKIKLKDPKDWKIAGKPLKRLDTADKVTGKHAVFHGLQDARNALRGDQGMPGVRRQAQELRRRQGHRHAGREEGRAVRRCRGGGGGRHLVAGQDRARRAADRLGRRRRTPRSRAHRSPSGSRPGSTPKTAFVGNKQGDAKAAIARRGEEGRGGLRLSVPEPRPHGADERDRALYGRQVRGLDQLAERRGRVRRDRRRPPACRPTSATCTTRLLGGGFGRRARSDYVVARGARRQGDAGHADQADQVA